MRESNSHLPITKRPSYHLTNGASWDPIFIASTALVGDDPTPPTWGLSAGERTRTLNLLLTRELHYQLCYTGITRI